MFSKTSGLLWIRLISNWSKPLADFVLNNPTTANLLPPLKPNQHWATQATILTRALTEDKEEDWKASDRITTAQVALLSHNTSNPTTTSVVVTLAPDNQSVLTSDSATRDITPTKRSPPRPAAASQSKTRRAKFRILFSLFAAYDRNANTIQPPILTDTADKIANMDSTTMRIGILTSAIDHLLNIASAERDCLSRAVRWPNNLSNLTKGQLAQGLFRTQFTRSFKDAKD